MKVLLLCLLGTAGATSGAEEKFQQFEAFYGKNSADEERATRFAAFSENLEVIATLQKANPEAVYSHLTPFADISAQEFQATRFGLTYTEKDAVSHLSAPRLDVSGLPSSFDWRSKGGVNAVQNQGACGSCWSFSVAANLEGAGFASTGRLVKVSEEQLVDCSAQNSGCNGGWPSRAYQEMIDLNYGLETAADYPYTAGTTKAPGSCQQQASKELLFIGSWLQLSTDEDQMAAGLMQYGVLSIALDATPLQTYSSGVLSMPWWRSCNSVNHGVAIVGFGSSPKKYWTVRNSWGSGWGEQGYVRMARGSGMCQLNRAATSVTGVSFKGSVAV